MEQNGTKRVAIGVTAASPAAYIPNNQVQQLDKKQPFQRQGTHQPSNSKNGTGNLQSSGTGGAMLKHTALRPAEINTFKAPQQNN